MKTLMTALALASVVATSAVAAKNEREQGVNAGPNNPVIICRNAAMTDPDPAIRAQLVRDCVHSEGN